MKITILPDCGNSPKKEILKKFNIAFASGDSKSILEMISEDFTWEIVGESLVSGKEQLEEILPKIPFDQNKEIIVDKIITHGREAATYGEIILIDDTRYKFADIYEFSNAFGKMIQSLISFNIKLS
ncbi:MAG: nuclear transport factor 2 family protein [Candidatus Heimdallarchaeota archaeon]|nr:nuclear transport factor 2 family protein [Candidatus Heimdallarchaeota archaeon]